MQGVDFLASKKNGCGVLVGRAERTGVQSQVLIHGRINQLDLASNLYLNMCFFRE